METSYGLSQELLNRVEVHNQAMNPDGEKTFLLPMASAQGSPTHPAYPSGHAINVGAYITALKVMLTPALSYISRLPCSICRAAN